MKQPKQVPAMSTADLATTLSKHGVQLFKDRSGMPLNQAQRNLEGRTHYVDDSTLKSFVAKIHSVSVMDDGLILGIVESCQKGPSSDSGRVFRPVFFDVFGNTVYRPDLDESFDSQKQAMSDFWKQADEIDAIKATIEGAKAKHKALAQAADDFSELLEELE